VTAAAYDPSSNGMDLLAYCVDCSRDLCGAHLKVHFCRAMKQAGAKKGDAPARYEEDANS
jgi:hypothetical protein